jgi:hypoxanthine phosphoribosyltransferase
VTSAERLRAEGHPIGEIYLGRAEIAARVAELGRELSDAYAGTSSPPRRAAQVERGVPRGPLAGLHVDHELDVIELAPYGSGRTGGGVRLLKDLDRPLAGRDVLLVEDVVDTGLTLGFLTRCFAERGPASLAAVTLLDRPYRRLVDEIPLDHVGFTVPDELFAGYGLGLEERWRALPDLHLVVADELPAAIDAA